MLQRYLPRRSHFLRLLGSLILALTVWIYVTISRNPETQFAFENVSIQVRGLATDFVLTNAEGLPLAAVDKVAVTMWAPESEALRVNDLQVFIDLTSVAEAGMYKALVQVETDRAVRTWTVTPAELVVRVDPLRQGLFPVQMNLLGQPGLPYIVGTPQINPEYAVVRGPLSRLTLVNRVEARVDLAGRVSAVENVLVALVPVDEGGNMVEGVTVVPTQATMSVPISLKGGHVAISIVPVTTGRPAAGYYLREINVDPDTVTIFSGDPDILAAIRFLETEPVDLSGRRADFARRMTLRLPANVSLINSRAQVTVTVYLGVVTPELDLVLPVRLKGRTAEVTATWEPQWVDVRASGAPAALRGLTLNDLWALVDVEGLGSGEYYLPLIFPAPTGVLIRPLYTDTVHVVLTWPPTLTPTLTPTVTVVPTTTLSPITTPSPLGTPGPLPPYPAGTTPPAAVMPTPTPTPTRLPSPTP